MLLKKKRVYGYTSIGGRDEIIPEEVEAVRYFMNRLMKLPDTMPVNAMVDILIKEAKEKKFPLPPEGDWTRKVVEKILNSPIYIGGRLII